MEDVWKKTIEEKLDNIYNELTDGSVRKGLYSQTKQNSSDIAQLKTTVEEDHEVVNEIRELKKWSMRAIGLGLLAAIGKFLWWLVDLAKMGWKLAALYITNHNHNA